MYFQKKNCLETFCVEKKLGTNYIKLIKSVKANYLCIYLIAGIILVSGNKYIDGINGINLQLKIYCSLRYKCSRWNLCEFYHGFSRISIGILFKKIIAEKLNAHLSNSVRGLTKTCNWPFERVDDLLYTKISFKSVGDYSLSCLYINSATFIRPFGQSSSCVLHYLKHFIW